MDHFHIPSLIRIRLEVQGVQVVDFFESKNASKCQKKVKQQNDEIVKEDQSVDISF